MWKVQIMVSVVDASAVFQRFLESDSVMGLEGPDKQDDDFDRSMNAIGNIATWSSTETARSVSSVCVVAVRRSSMDC